MPRPLLHGGRTSPEHTLAFDNWDPGGSEKGLLGEQSKLLMTSC